MTAARPRLGLALSGGGFRASFFHLGVLRRLAELDLLRDVSVLSTVSGGSIVAAHYYLHLKAALEENGALSSADYVSIVDGVEGEFRRGVSKNLRTLLFMDPIETAWRLSTGDPAGRRMARLYSQHLYGAITERLFPGSPYVWDGIPLQEAKVDPGRRRHALAEGIDAHNAVAPDRIPRFVLNATCLNTGLPFRFTLDEVGTPRLGFLRFDEAKLVSWYKRLLSPKRAFDDVRKEAQRDPGGWKWGPPSARREGHPEWLPFGWTTPANLSWWRAASGEAAAPPTSGTVAALLAPRGEISKLLLNAEIAHLRTAKTAAWFLLEEKRRGRWTDPELEVVLWDAIEDVDKALAAELRGLGLDRGEARPAFFEFLLDLYYFRSAAAFDEKALEALGRLTLADAVAASANFPPVFPPYKVAGLYDARRAPAVSLTDGGVYDNQGVEALLEERCTHVIASDAGGLFKEGHGTWDLRSSMMGRIVEAMMFNIRDQQLAALRERRRVAEAVAACPPHASLDDLRSRYKLEAVSFFHMTSNPSDAALPDALAPHPLAAEVARIRTDLDAFSEVEADALVYQGYQISDRFVRKYLSTPYYADLRANAPRREMPRGGEAVLRAASGRFFRVLAHWRVLKVVLGVAAVALLFGLGAAGVSAAGAGRGLVAAVAWVARHPLLLPGFEVPLDARWSVPLVAAFLALAAAGRAAAPRCGPVLGLVLRNLIWLVGLLPAIGALALTAVMAVVWLADLPLARIGRRPSQPGGRAGVASPSSPSGAPARAGRAGSIPGPRSSDASP